VGEYVTEDKARLIVVDMLKDYEREVIVPRHAETQSELGEIKGIVNKGKGAALLASAVMSVGGFIWIVLQVKQAIQH
jgi:hypothetical protein